MLKNINFFGSIDNLGHRFVFIYYRYTNFIYRLTLSNKSSEQYLFLSRSLSCSMNRPIKIRGKIDCLTDKNNLAFCYIVNKI